MPKKHTDGGCWCGKFHSAGMRGASKESAIKYAPLKALLKKQK